MSSGVLFKKTKSSCSTLCIILSLYIAKQGDRAQPIRHDGGRREPATFEGNPTYKGIFFSE